MKTELLVFKIGGNVIDCEDELNAFLSGLSVLNKPFILIHGGGKLATDFSTRLGIKTEQVNGRRITDLDTLKVVTMVYGGWINKQIVAGLQARGKNALGVTGADSNLIKTNKRTVDPIDFGYVGDCTPDSVNASAIEMFLKYNLVPVIAPITHNGKGQLLNTNADTIATEIAIALNKTYRVRLFMCFEKQGVLADPEKPESVISELTFSDYMELKAEKKIHSGMLPKLENGFKASASGVQVWIGKSTQVFNSINKHESGTYLA